MGEMLAVNKRRDRARSGVKTLPAVHPKTLSILEGNPQEKVGRVGLPQELQGSCPDGKSSPERG